MHTWKVCFKINAGKTLSVDALFMPLLDRDCTNIWYEYWDNTTQCKALGTVLSHANLTVLTTMARLWVYVGDKKNPFEKLVQPSLAENGLKEACMHGRTDNNGNSYNCRSCLDRVTLHSMSNGDFVSYITGKWSSSKILEQKNWIVAIAFWKGLISKWCRL